MIAVDATPPHICLSCGADEMGCAVKRGLSGRLCCSGCSHLVVRKTPTTTQGDKK